MATERTTERVMKIAALAGTVAGVLVADLGDGSPLVVFVSGCLCGLIAAGALKVLFNLLD